ncbi:hypothetical protein SE951_05620 [Escherichia coli]|nr:hypothetical protein [Escherichia coli]
MNGELYRATYDAIHGPSLSEWVKINIDLYDIAKILSMTTNDNYGDPYAGSITLAAFNSRGSTKTASVVRGQYYPGSVLTPMVFSVPEGHYRRRRLGFLVQRSTHCRVFTVHYPEPRITPEKVSLLLLLL